MQFPTWLVSKVRKPALVISIVVAMASFLIAWGEPTNQVQTMPAPTPIPFADAMSAIDAQRQQSYTAIQQIDYLYQKNAFQGCAADYYGNAKYYYNTYVQSNFNAWLESLASEVQNGATLLNTGPDDLTLISNALRANYAFTTWARLVYYYFSTPTNSCSQGQGGYLIATFPKGLPAFEPIEFFKVKLSELDPEALKKFSDVLDYGRKLIPTPTPTLPGGSSLFPTPSVNDLLGVPEWQKHFCDVVPGSSC